MTSEQLIHSFVLYILFQIYFKLGQCIITVVSGSIVTVLMKNILSLICCKFLLSQVLSDNSIIKHFTNNCITTMWNDIEIATSQGTSIYSLKISEGSILTRKRERERDRRNALFLESRLLRGVE